MRENRLFIIVPCYNEEETLEDSAEKLLLKLDRLILEQKIAENSRILFVDDGSKDHTWEMIQRFSSQNCKYSGLSLAHNRGHQNALLAGLMFAKDHCDMCISIDADLQQDIEAMDLFIEKYQQGCEIVYGVRNSRNTDSVFKKTSAGMFYKCMKLLGCDIYENSADYRLMSKKALVALSEYQEVNIFLRGIIPDIGLPCDVVHFDVFPRNFGTSKYTLKKMFHLALDGITAFSIRPIHIICVTGVIFLFISIIMIISCLVEYFMGKTVAGYPTIVCTLWFIGGIQLFALGILGEYIGRNYEETKKRPRYFIKDIYFQENDE